MISLQPSAHAGPTPQHARAGNAQATPAMPDAQAHFDDWLNSRASPNSGPRQHLSSHAAMPYRYIWSSWVQWLTEPTALSDAPSACALASHWTLAQAHHVAAFLDEGVIAAACARRGPAAPISLITRRRYWRVLDLLYAHAVRRGLMAHNPLSAPDLEVPPQEVCEGLVLLGPRWDAVLKALPGAADRWSVRDRALLLLLMEAGLRLSELLDLRVGDVGQLHRPMTLAVRGSRSAQPRMLTLDGSVGPALQSWLKEREDVQLHPNTPHDLLLVSLRGRAMSARSVFLIVSNVVARGLQLAGFELAQHLGPQVLRNSCIVRWLHAGRDPFEVCRLAGLKDPRSFRGLQRHLPPSVTSISRKTLHAHASSCGAFPKQPAD